MLVLLILEDNNSGIDKDLGYQINSQDEDPEPTACTYF